MDEQRRNRMAAAITANAILLIVILAAVLIYQIVVLSVISAQRKSILEEIEKYEKLTEQAQDDLEYLQSEQYLLDLALQYGYTYND